MDTLLSSPVPGIIASIVCFSTGCRIRERFPSPLTNPLIIANILIILVVLFTPLTVERYRNGGNMITMFILPATTILALRIYRQRAVLRANVIPVFAGCLAGSLASIGAVLGLCRLFRIDQVVTMSLLPKSVTTAIALELSARNGGLGGITLSAVIVTGMASAIMSPFFVKALGLKDPVASGIAIGTSGHAIGTAAALELGETEGAMSGLAMALSGIITSVLFMLLF
ncbi:MAG: LrgB family protein [Spirochaetaceae bacterium]|jgi:putative effector of murein hydrolase|nr:LrgB family protein [Spirochaetaceae bacterium]